MDKTETDIKARTFDFSVRIIELYQYLRNEKKEFTLGKQLLRAGTSVGANVEEATAAQSKRDFIAKMSISLKEARETNYWLRLLKRTGYISKDELILESEEIMNILGAIIRTSKKNMEQQLDSYHAINF
ncbi:MAG: four helix bundle protein [Candidatus Marinimicrobia bacterium]|nr:four helix bundle protein [Candidatus Neomarinimicrobiota bacterium]